jgi:putative nucleotidyltransferase with HDIG domain
MITSQEIENLFAKQLSKIKNIELRVQVVETWVRGCQRGNWENTDELKKMPFTLLTNPKGISFIEHTIAVTEGALALAETQRSTYKHMPYPIDFDRIIAGGILHDVGKLLEIEKDGKGGYRKSLNGKFTRHPISGAMLAHEVGLPGEIINIIACHAKEGEGRPQVVETVLIHLADFATFDPLVFLEKGQLIVDETKL